MNCQHLASLIERLQPGAEPREVARLCLLLVNSVENPQDLEEESVLLEVWRETQLRLQAAADQHAAMTEELERLASEHSTPLSQDQAWVLLRAIRVQNQLLEFYLGEAPAAA